ncbi:GspB domain-containing protein [Alteromonas sp. 345S023]|uniref:GspB domain-containing protein n=1 Tax=Alteromonas profundi TaxID=2696062 RepID=A0A7X5LJ75_9ALTE|nr:general secretion pathway protein GspB [Alteromonas profundi]NDV89725.1 GspB domain-containing protein [Alteromonas profundi]
MSKLIDIEKLKPGMVIVQITKQNGPVKIRKSGLVSSDAMVQGLAEMGVQEVEVDLEQTVEIAPVVQRNTHTQALLRGDHDTSANFDKSLSEQFNRSLFLPTVQGLPSMWKRYAKDVAKFLVVVTLGLGIGFSVATASLWWPSWNALKLQTPNTAVKSDSTQDKGSATQTTGADKPSDTGEAHIAVPYDINADGESEPSLSTAKDANDGSAHATASITDNSEANSQPATQTERNANAGTSANTSGGSNDTVASLAGEGGEVLNEATDDSNVKVSPELLARFNAAVEALDTRAGNDDTSSKPKVTVRDDLQRVDQLPVRLLTRLPSMNFSAHMYASQAEDRWVRVNGKQRFEGDWIDDKVQIVNIEAQRVVLSFEDELFTMSALTDW